MAEAKKPEAQKPKEVLKDVVLVGKKPLMSYVMAALLQLTQSDSITIKARGRAISRAVDVAQILANRFIGDSSAIKSIKIDTETLGDPPRNVSVIEIVVSGKPLKK
ncbi:MAG: DNA-binding protein Alba [Candidatus Verstraetearchaeota archaeon]|jgi:DNA-binding protein|nr:DNA-binding protein Alba [Candidatus Verstraetearchaeota archaeon]